MKLLSDQQNKESQVRDILSQYVYQDKWIGTKKLDRAVKQIMEVFESSIHMNGDVITKFPWEDKK